MKETLHFANSGDVIDCIKLDMKTQVLIFKSVCVTVTRVFEIFKIWYFIIFDGKTIILNNDHNIDNSI